MGLTFSGKQDVYLEIVQRYENYIRRGVLKNGEKLPSVRVAAAEIGVNPNTVQKAFRILEEKGLIASLPKKGVYVTFSGQEEAPRVDEALYAAVLALKHQGVSREALQQMIEEVYSDDRDS